MTMKLILVLCALVAVGSCTIWEGGFRVKFGVGPDPGSSFFYDIPRTRIDAVIAGWTRKEPVEGLPLTSVNLHCYSDLIVCTFYDTYGDVAGLQLAVPVDSITGNYYDMEETGFTKWTPAVASGQTPITYWTIQQYFTTEEILRNRRGRASTNKITENGGVWVTGVGKELRLIHNTSVAIVREDVFKRQACSRWMGRHYYYQMTQQTSCEAEPLYPWFALVESGELIGTGFTVFGKLTLPSGARNWYESPDMEVIKNILTDGPQCAFDLASAGVFTLHIYYIDKPWLMLSCLYN